MKIKKTQILVKCKLINKIILENFKNYFLYIISIILLVLFVEVFIHTALLGLLPSLVTAFMNFFKIIAVISIANRLKQYLINKFNINNIFIKLMILILKNPIIPYSLYLCCYVASSLLLYWILDDVLLANIALQSAIAMIIGILLGIIAYMQNNKKNIWMTLLFSRGHFFDFHLKKTYL